MEKLTRMLGRVRGEREAMLEGGDYFSSPNLRVRTTSSWPGVSWSYNCLVAERTGMAENLLRRSYY